MSMQHYAVNDYGLYLDFETMNHMASKICDDYTPEAFADDEWHFMNELYEQCVVDYIGELTGEALCVQDDGRPMWGVPHWVYSNDTCWYIPLFKQSRMFGAAYQSMEEVIAELRDRLGKYLPDDFDYRKNLCLVCGTYFG